MGQGRMENPYQKANTLNLIDARRIQVMDTKVLRCWVFCQKVVPTSLIFLSWWPLFLWLVSLTWGRRGDSGPLFLRLADHSLETWAGGFPLKHVTSRKLAHLASVRIFFICIVRIIIFVNQDVIYLQWSLETTCKVCGWQSHHTVRLYQAQATLRNLAAHSFQRKQQILEKKGEEVTGPSICHLSFISLSCVSTIFLTLTWN